MPAAAHIALVIAGLAGGGAERVISALANQLAARGHAVSLVTLDAMATDFYALHPGVRRLRLGAAVSGGRVRRLACELSLLRALRATIRRAAPDAVLSFGAETNVRTLIACAGMRVPVVVSERTDPAQHHVGEPWAVLRRHVYRLATHVVAQTEAAARWVRARTSARRVVVIPNPVAPPPPAQPTARRFPAPAVVAMGRLRPEKGYDLLLEAFRSARARHPAWHLAFIGDGPERERLERDAARLGLADAVTFVGELAQPLDVLRQGDVFALSSRYEGFPNALLEAMACGLPVVSFDCPSGPGDIVRHEADGLLVPPLEVEALGDALTRLMGDASLRARLADSARAVVDRFAADRVVPQWVALLRRPAHAPRVPERPASAREVLVL